MSQLNPALKGIAGRDFPVVAAMHALAQRYDHALSTRFAPLTGYPISLCALGGYGRRECFPAADLDLLILCDESTRRQAQAELERFIQALWNLGQPIAQRVLSPEECFRDAHSDLELLTALLEARTLAGPPEPLAQLQTSIRQIHTPSEFIALKIAENRRREDQAAGQLEPNIKTTSGGLRDLHTATWIARYCYGPQADPSLFLDEEEREALWTATQDLWRLRFALHQLSGRDRLGFEQQKLLAAHFGYCDDDEGLAIEYLMRDYYRLTRTVRRLTRHVVQCMALEHEAKTPPVPLIWPFVRCGSRLDCLETATFAAHPEWFFRAHALVQQQPEIEDFHPRFARTLRRVRPQLFSADFLHSRERRREFLDLLSRPGRVAPVLKMMLHQGTFYRYVPAFWSAVGQMQYDLFHQYTVEHHTLRVVEILDGFSLPNPSYPQAFETLARFEHPETLYLAAIFHDIGKGHGGDHSVVGAQMLRAFLDEAPGVMPPEEETLAVFLVRHHLMLSQTAQKKDLSDPAVIADFAAQFAHRRALDALYLLTMADISATNAKLWNSWRAQMLHTLWQRSCAEGQNAEQVRAQAAACLPEAVRAQWWPRLPPPFFSNETAANIVHKTEALAASPSAFGLEVLQESPSRLMLFAPIETAELFARSACALEQQNANIVEARLYQTLDGARALLQYTLSEVLPAEARAALQKALRQSPKLPTQRLTNARLRHFNPPAKILWERAEGASVLHLSCKDHFGLLSRLARAFWAAGVRVTHAKINTFGEKVEDTFYLTTAAGAALSTAERAALSQTLQQLLETL